MSVESIAASCRLLAGAWLVTALSSCCHDVERLSCIPWDDPSAPCPSRAMAREELSVDAVLSDGVFWPQRTLVIEGMPTTDPATCCYDTRDEQCTRNF